jgi:hypothetical protein
MTLKQRDTFRQKNVTELRVRISHRKIIKYLKGGDDLEDLSIDGRIIFK